jgi:16S rRNA (cytosine967-C5)-methyltransferase
MSRLVAFAILRSGSTTPLRDVERFSDEAELDARDRGLVRRILGTEVRHRTTIRAVIHAIAPAIKNAEMLAHLHVALAQALFLDRIPPHAVLAECSDAVRQTLGPAKVRIAREFLKSLYDRLENARSGDPRRDLVGRNVSFREPVFRDPTEHPLLWAEDALSMPAPMLKRWIARHGEAKARALAELALDEAPLSMRVVAGERAELANELRALGIETRDGVHERVLLAPSATAEAVTTCAAFTEGRLTIQGEHALRAAEALQARAGEELVDLCAAPGGKTAVLAASGARVIACDSNESRLERLRSTVQRLGVAERVEVLATDAGEALGTRTFDGVLVDAPCSNTGVLAQRPEARWRFGPASRAELAAIQTRLIDRAAELVRPGGRLVWSTCSIEPEENRRTVDAFLARHAGWTLEEERESLPDTDTAQERGSGPIDGGYFARLRRAP